MTRIIAVAILASAGLAIAQPAPPAAAPAASGLPEAPEKATMVRVCSGCHEAEAVTSKRLTPDGWKELVEQMAANGAQGSDADFAAITTYLARSFPAS